MSYIVKCRVGGKVKRITLGRHGPLTADEARKKAQKMLMDIQSAKTTVSIPTLEQILEEYLASRKLRPNTIKNYTMSIRHCLKD